MARQKDCSAALGILGGFFSAPQAATFNRFVCTIVKAVVLYR
jgi:hypothetical protein